MLSSRVSIRWALALCVATFLPRSSADELTTIFVVRHAEKAGNSGDFSLSEAGRRRAEELADILASYRLTAVYSTRTERTRQTAAPTSRAAQLEIADYGETTKQ